MSKSLTAKIQGIQISSEIFNFRHDHPRNQHKVIPFRKLQIILIIIKRSTFHWGELHFRPLATTHFEPSQTEPMLKSTKGVGLGRYVKKAKIEKYFGTFRIVFCKKITKNLENGTKFPKFWKKYSNFGKYQEKNLIRQHIFPFRYFGNFNLPFVFNTFVNFPEFSDI